MFVTAILRLSDLDIYVSLIREKSNKEQSQVSEQK